MSDNYVPALAIIAILGWCLGSYVGDIISLWLRKQPLIYDPQKLYNYWKSQGEDP